MTTFLSYVGKIAMPFIAQKFLWGMLGIIVGEKFNFVFKNILIKFETKIENLIMQDIKCQKIGQKINIASLNESKAFLPLRDEKNAR